MTNYEFPIKEPPTEVLGFQFWKACNLWRRMHQEALRPFGISHGQFVLLGCIFYLETSSDGEIHQRQIAQFSQVDKMTTSQVIAALEQKKLVTKTRSKIDRRAYRILCTDKGKELVQTTVPIVLGNDKKFFGCLEEKEEELLEMLLKLQD